MKNDQLAAVFLSKAVSAAASKNFTAALEDYNNCLRFATSTSNLPIEVYMGRAFIYCELVQFENCFQNLRLAFNEEFGCHRRFFKLMELCARCHRMLGDADAFAKDSHGSIMNFFKLSLPSNPKIPFIADCLQVRKTEEFGRAIMTTKSLKTGDVVVIEEPFYKVLDASLKHLRCAICLRQSNLDLIACETCSNAMFCSIECRNSIVHQHECKSANAESFTKRLLKRMFYQAIEICGSLEKLQQLMIRHDIAKTAMDLDFSGDQMIVGENKLLAMNCLDLHEHPEQDVIESVVQELLEFALNDKQKSFLRDYLKKCLNSQRVNFFRFFWSPQQVEGLGFAVCNISAYLLHSCDPNVAKIDVDNKFVFVVKKPITAGDNLYLGYDRKCFVNVSRAERQKYFKSVYSFICGCDACKKDYPMLSKLRRFDRQFVSPEMEIRSIEAAKEQYQKNCEYIEKHIAQYPCFEISSSMQQNDELLHFIGNNNFPF